MSGKVTGTIGIPEAVWRPDAISFYKIGNADFAIEQNEVSDAIKERLKDLNKDHKALFTAAKAIIGQLNNLTISDITKPEPEFATEPDLVADLDSINFDDIADDISDDDGKNKIDDMFNEQLILNPIKKGVDATIPEYDAVVDEYKSPIYDALQPKVLEMIEEKGEVEFLDKYIDGKIWIRGADRLQVLNEDHLSVTQSKYSKAGWYLPEVSEVAAILDAESKWSNAKEQFIDEVYVIKSKLGFSIFQFVLSKANEIEGMLRNFYAETYLKDMDIYTMQLKAAEMYYSLLNKNKEIDIMINKWKLEAFKAKAKVFSILIPAKIQIAENSLKIYDTLESMKLKVKELENIIFELTGKVKAREVEAADIEFKTDITIAKSDLEKTLKIAEKKVKASDMLARLYTQMAAALYASMHMSVNLTDSFNQQLGIQHEQSLDTSSSLEEELSSTITSSTS